MVTKADLMADHAVEGQVDLLSPFIALAKERNIPFWIGEGKFTFIGVSVFVDVFVLVFDCVYVSICIHMFVGLGLSMHTERQINALLECTAIVVVVILAQQV